MARKRVEKAEMSTAAEAKTRPVRVDLLPDDHRLLRLVSADEELSMAAMARDLLSRTIHDEAKRRGIKP